MLDALFAFCAAYLHAKLCLLNVLVTCLSKYYFKIIYLITKQARVAFPMLRSIQCLVGGNCLLLSTLGEFRVYPTITNKVATYLPVFQQCTHLPLGDLNIGILMIMIQHTQGLLIHEFSVTLNRQATLKRNGEFCSMEKLAALLECPLLFGVILETCHMTLSFLQSTSLELPWLFQSFLETCEWL